MKLQILLVLLLCICLAEIEARRGGRRGGGQRGGGQQRGGQRGFRRFGNQNLSYTIQIRNNLVEANFDETATITQRGCLLGGLVQAANADANFVFAAEYIVATGFNIIRLNSLDNSAAGNWVLTRNGVAFTGRLESFSPVNGDVFLFDFVAP